MVMIFLESNFKGLYLIFYKEFENCFLLFTSFRKREIGSYVVVVQRWQRSVQKSVMRRQSSIVFFVAVVVVVVAALSLTWPAAM